MTFLVGTYFESYIGKSDEILQGILTKHDDIYLSALFNPGAPETFITDAFALFDAMLAYLKMATCCVFGKYKYNKIYNF